MIRKTLILALSFCVVHAHAAENSTCDAVLAPDVTIVKTNDSIFYSLLQVIDESNYEKFREKYSADFPGYFSGDYGKFKEARSNFYQSTDLKLNVNQSRNILQSSIPEVRAKSWLECVTNSGAGIFLYVHDADETGATLKIKWAPPPGLGNLRNPTLSIQQGTYLPNQFSGSQAFVGEADVILHRSEKGGAVRGVASGIAGNNGSYSREFYIPASPKLYKISVKDSESASEFDSYFTVPRTPLPKDVALTIESSTTQTGEHFTQCCRFIQQYVWVDDAPKYSTPEIPFDEGEVKTLKHSMQVTVPAGKQIKVRVRNNGKGAKMGETELRWSGEYEILK